MGCALKETNPRIQVIGVQPARLPSVKVALAEGKPVTLPSAVTIADGIAVRRAGERTLPLIQKYVDDVVTVEEEEIANAVLLLLEEDTGRKEQVPPLLAALVNRRSPLEFIEIRQRFCRSRGVEAVKMSTITGTISSATPDQGDETGPPARPSSGLSRCPA